MKKKNNSWNESNRWDSFDKIKNLANQLVSTRLANTMEYLLYRHLFKQKSKQVANTPMLGTIPIGRNKSFQNYTHKFIECNDVNVCR